MVPADISLTLFRSHSFAFDRVRGASLLPGSQKETIIGKGVWLLQMSKDVSELKAKLIEAIFISFLVQFAVV